MTYPLLHVDAVQAFQYLNCNVNDLGVDLMTLSAHKIYGPKGIGALYVRQSAKRPDGDGIEDPRQSRDKAQSVNDSRFAIRDLLLAPLVTGGGQERGLRSGTENVPYIAGFAEAVKITDKMRKKEAERVAQLRDYFWKGIKKIYSKAAINGSIKERLPNNLNVYFPGHNAGDLLIKLDLAGVAASPGAACSARAAKPSYVLEALGFSHARCTESLRFSLGRQTSKSEIDAALKVLKNIF